MAQQTIDVGDFVDDPTAESILAAFTKVNAMTLELFTELALGGRAEIDLLSPSDTIRDAFIKTNANLAALYTEQSLPSVPIIDVGDAPDDPVPTAETIYAAFVKVNTAMDALYDSLEPIVTGPALAFPGALGWGGTTRHAYAAGTAPTIYRVTNLSDSGTGSLRAALIATGPRVVIFETSGTIPLTSQITITSPYLAVYGATAPDPGITVRNHTISIQTHNVLLQHLRVRAGNTLIADKDCITIYQNASYNIIVDHCSLSWSMDELFGISAASALATANSNITVSHCILAEGLRNSGHSQGSHSMGLLVYGNRRLVAVIGNLLAHNIDRNPYSQANTRTAIVNNWMYDWNGAATLFSGYNGTGPIQTSVVGNVYKQGPSSSGTLYAIRTDITGSGHSPVAAGSQMYRSDNLTIGTVTAFFNGSGGNLAEVGAPPVWPSGLVAGPASGVIAAVTANSGARPLDRDSVDNRIITQATNGTGGWINSQSEVGGWPSLAQNTRALTTPASPHAVQASGYTNLEEWAHDYANDLEP